MIDRVVDLIGIFAQPIIKFAKRPGRLPFRIYRLGYLPNIARNLCIAAEIVNKLGVGGSEETLTDGTESGFCRRPGFLDAFVSS
jgi:hypothetical protein